MKKFDLWPRTRWRIMIAAAKTLGRSVVHPRAAFSIINPENIKVFLAYYGGGSEMHQADFNTANLGYGFYHYGLLRIIRPRRVLCVGSLRGFIPALCALACKDNHFGRVDFVDAGYDWKSIKGWGGDGFWKRRDWRRYFSSLGLLPWLRAYVMTTKQFWRRYHYHYDYIYIDGDHSYRGVRRDYRLFWPRLRKRGFMAFHDISRHEKTRWGAFGVWRFWQELKGNKISFDWVESGLGIIQKYEI